MGESLRAARVAPPVPLSLRRCVLQRAPRRGRALRTGRWRTAARTRRPACACAPRACASLSAPLPRLLRCRTAPADVPAAGKQVCLCCANAGCLLLSPTPTARPACLRACDAVPPPLARPCARAVSCPLESGAAPPPPRARGVSAAAERVPTCACRAAGGRAPAAQLRPLMRAGCFILLVSVDSALSASAQLQRASEAPSTGWAVCQCV